MSKSMGLMFRRLLNGLEGPSGELGVLRCIAPSYGPPWVRPTIKGLFHEHRAKNKNKCNYFNEILPLGAAVTMLS